MAYIIKQCPAIVNDAVKDALGTNATLSTLDSTDLVAMGKLIDRYDAYEGFFGSLVNRIVKTVIFLRTYEANTRRILRDEHEYGAFIQKVYYLMPEAVENPVYKIPQITQTETTYTQESPYDVDTTIAVTARIYGGQGTYAQEFIRPVDQIRTAFLDSAAMMNFIDGLYLAAENRQKLEEERLVALAANTAMAMDILNGKARNLLSEYNTNHAGATLTVAEAMESADFLKYASKEINDTILNMQSMSGVFNVQEYPTFTSKDNLVVEMLGKFASASDMYLQADTFHNELVKLPNFERVPFWQGSGSNFAFNDVSKIKVQHDDFIDSDAPSSTGVVEQGGIICFLHDIEHVAAYFGHRRDWEKYNERQDVYIHGSVTRKGFAVDSFANGMVFYIA